MSFYNIICRLVNSNINEQRRKETLIHELQHVVQSYEGFTSGTSTFTFKDSSNDSRMLSQAQYEKTAGEIEARDTATRKNLSEEQRKNTPPDIDRTDVVFADGGMSYSADDRDLDIKDEFEKNVDKVKNNTYNSDNAIIMGATPKVLQNIGLNALPIAITKNHIYSIAVTEQQAKLEKRYNKNANYHGLGYQTVKEIYEKISNPLMVIAHPNYCFDC